MSNLSCIDKVNKIRTNALKDISTLKNNYKNVLTQWKELALLEKEDQEREV